MVVEILTIGIPLILCIVTATITYSLGKKSKKYEMLLEKAIPLAESISNKFNTIDLVNNRLVEYYYKNFGHMDSFHQSMESFDKYFDSLHKVVGENINELMKLRDNLRAEISKSSLYLDHYLIADINKYLNLGDFTFADSALYSEFYEAFWENLLDKEKVKLRKILFNDISKNIIRLLPK